MQYINPIEILGLSNATDISNLDNDIIKRAKRKLFADIDLSDNGFFEYHGLQLTKSDCEIVIDELSNDDYKKYHLYLISNTKLNSFLMNGNTEFFKKLKKHIIFKEPEFVKFISPYFAPKFDKALLVVIEEDNEIRTKAILNTTLLIAHSDINTAFKSVSCYLENIIYRIEQIQYGIDKKSTYTQYNIENAVDKIRNKIPIPILNCLPQYFQSQLLKVAKSINNLQCAIWKKFDHIQLCYDLIVLVTTLNIEGLDIPLYKNNYKIIKKKNDERIEKVKNGLNCKKWKNVLDELTVYNKEVEQKKLSSDLAYKLTSKLFDLNELNLLSNFKDDIRTRIAYAIRNLSISIGKIYGDIVNSIKTITIALQINVNNEDYVKFKKDLVIFQFNIKKVQKNLILSYG